MKLRRSELMKLIPLALGTPKPRADSTRPRVFIKFWGYPFIFERTEAKSQRPEVRKQGHVQGLHHRVSDPES